MFDYSSTQNSQLPNQFTDLSVNSNTIGMSQAFGISNELLSPPTLQRTSTDYSLTQQLSNIPQSLPQQPVSQQFSFNPPSVQSNYGQPPVQSNYGQPPVQSNYGQPPVQSNYGQPPVQSNYGQPPVQSEYPQATAQGYNQNAGPEIFNPAPQSQVNMYGSFNPPPAPQKQPFVYDPRVHTTNEPNLISPLSVSATVQSYGGTFNAPPQPKTEYPYLVFGAVYDSRNVLLVHIDSKRFLLVYEADLQLAVTDTSGQTYLQKSKEKFATPYGDKNGYIFWAQTKKYLDLLDSLFTTEWRKGLKVALPEKKESSFLLLHSCDYNGFHYDIYEYSEKAVAVFTNGPFVKGMANQYVKHPVTGAGGCYFLSKQQNKIAEVEQMFNCSLGPKFTLSAPLASKGPTAVANEPVLLKTTNTIRGDIRFTLEQWRYSELSYALTFTPNANIENEFIRYNPDLTFGGVKRGGYIFAKNNKTHTDYLKSLMPEAILDDAVIIPTTLSNVIPAAKTEQKISDLSISLLNKLSKCDVFTQEEAHGKTIMYGPTDDVESSISGEILMKIIVGERCLIVSKNGLDTY
jgi:hypothetical protein